MHSSLEFVSHYFTQEKIESIFFVIIGLSSIALALFFLTIIKYSLYKGMAYPFLLIGLIQFSVGFNVFNRCDKDITRVETMVSTNLQQIVTEELPRMQMVMTNFSMYLWIEIALVLIGICLLIKNNKPTQSFWKGVGLGLLIQASVMLVLDVIAQQRAEIYMKYLTDLVSN